MSVPHPAAPAIAEAGPSPDPRTFVVCGFPGSGVAHLLAALMARQSPELQTLPPLQLPSHGGMPAAPAPVDPPARRIAQSWRPLAHDDGLVLVRNPFHVFAELLAMAGGGGEAAARGRGALLQSIVTALFPDDPSAGGAPYAGPFPVDDDTFAALVGSLWARHIRGMLSRGWPVLQYERLTAHEEAVVATIADLAAKGAPLPAPASPLRLPSDSLSAAATAAPLTPLQMGALRLAAGDMLEACGYLWQADGDLIIDLPRPTEGPVEPSPGRDLQPFQAQMAAFEGLSAEVRRALDAGRRRERMFDTMSQIAADLCRQQEAAFQKSQQDVAELTAQVQQARTFLDHAKVRATQLQRDLAATRDSCLLLSDIDVTPPTAKFVRINDETIELGRTKATTARISFTLPSAAESNWLILLTVSVESDGTAAGALPPLAVSYVSGGRNRRVRQPVGPGDNALTFILSRVEPATAAHFLLEPRATPYRIRDIVFIPMTSAASLARNGEDEPPMPPSPAEEEADTD